MHLYLGFVKICDYSKESELFSVFIFVVAVEFEKQKSTSFVSPFPAT